MQLLCTRSLSRAWDKVRRNAEILGWQATFILASILDVATTWYALKYTGAVEGNPLMVGIANSVPLMLTVKALGFIIIASVVGATISFRHWHRWIWIVLSLITFAAVVNNLVVIGV